MTCGIYKITNTVTGEFYIGQSPNIEARWDTHVKKWHEQSSEYECKKLLANVQQHGVLVFAFEVLEVCDRKKLFTRESELIRKLKPSLNGRVSLTSQTKTVPLLNPYGVRNKIKEIVDSRSLSIYRFAKDVEISFPTAYKLYNNDSEMPGGQTLSSICATYDLDVDAVIYYIHPNRATA